MQNQIEAGLGTTIRRLLPQKIQIHIGLVGVSARVDRELKQAITISVKSHNPELNIKPLKDFSLQEHLFLVKTLLLIDKQ